MDKRDGTLMFQTSVFVDWITVHQAHPLGGLRILNDGKVFAVDHDRIIQWGIDREFEAEGSHDKHQCLPIDSVACIHDLAQPVSVLRGMPGGSQASLRGIELEGVIVEIPQEAAIAYMALAPNQVVPCSAAAD